MKRSLAGLAAATTTLLLAIAAPATAVPDTQLAPAALQRGPDVRIPHVEGHTVVDGDVRIPVHAGTVRLLGTSGDDYVVGTSNRAGDGRFRILRVDAGGGRRVVLRGVPVWNMVLSGDGARLGSSTDGRNTRVRAWDSSDGHLQAERRFRGSVTILDFVGARMVLGAWDPDRTLWWNTRTGGTTRISDQAGYAAQISADRLATLTGDPYDGGCSVVRSLSHPRHRVWRSCRERVWSFSPRGRVAAVPLLSDGVGPGDVYLRRPGGRLVAHYTSRWFGSVAWESERALLLDTNGARRSATVRCVARDCERASDLRPAPTV